MSNLADRFLPIGLAAAGLVLIHQLLELQGILGGIDLAMPGDRMRLLNGLEARLPALLLVDVLLVVAILHRGAIGPIKGLGWAHVAGGTLALLAVPLFFRDAGSMASAVGAGELASFRVLVVRTAGVLAALGAGSVIAGLRIRTMAR